MNRTRTEQDSWGIENSECSTEVGAAAARAVESARPDALFRDPHAELLVAQCGGNAFWKATLDPALVDQLQVVSESAAQQLRHLRGYTAARTRFFDGVCREATAGGLRQVVILAAGLDCRAHRLDWPSDTQLWEIDQPEVLAYKSTVLRANAGRSGIRPEYLPVDLRQNWPDALRATGFDTSAPTAWLAEGLVMYLPPEIQNSLLTTVTELSARGSRLALDTAPKRSRKRGEQTDSALTFAASALGLSQDLAVNALMYHDEDRTPVGSWLDQHGWRSTTVNSADEMCALDRWPDGMSSASDGDDARFASFVSAYHW